MLPPRPELSADPVDPVHCYGNSNDEAAGQRLDGASTFADAIKRTDTLRCVASKKRSSSQPEDKRPAYGPEQAETLWRAVRHKLSQHTNDIDEAIAAWESNSRPKSGFTQWDAIKILGINQSYFSNMLHRKPINLTFSKLLHLREVLGMEIHEIFGLPPLPGRVRESMRMVKSIEISDVVGEIERASSRDQLIEALARAVRRLGADHEGATGTESGVRSARKSAKKGR